jgi:hypothetical protein
MKVVIRRQVIAKAAGSSGKAAATRSGSRALREEKRKRQPIVSLEEVFRVTKEAGGV